MNTRCRRSEPACWSFIFQTDPRWESWPGTYWNSSHRPPISGKGVYRKDLAQAIGEAFLQYSGSSLQIHAPAITLDASRITLATKSGSITVAEIINHIKG